MSEAKAEHVTPADGNIFLDLGFEPEEAAAMLAEVRREVAQKKAIKFALMSQLKDWIEESSLKQEDAAKILGVTRPRVSDAVNKKVEKFTVDALIGMMSRAGKQLEIVAR